MKINKFKFFLIATTIFTSYNSLAADAVANNTDTVNAYSEQVSDTNSSNASDSQGKNEKDVEEIIGEYKKYLATLPEELRNEVVAYRKEIANLNKQKRKLYKELSQGAQNYLKKEWQFKKKLPLKHKNSISLDDLQESKAQEIAQ